MKAIFCRLFVGLLAVGPAGSQSSAGGAAASQPAGPQLVRTILIDKLSGPLGQLAVDEAGHRLFVAAPQANAVVVIDLNTGREVSRFTKPQGPTGVCCLPASGGVAVSSRRDGKLRTYGRDLSLLGFMEGLDDAGLLRYDAKLRRVWIAYDKALLEIGAGMLDRKREIKLDTAVIDFVLESRGTRMYALLNDGARVGVIDRRISRRMDEWQLKDDARGGAIGLDEAHGRLFVACVKPAVMRVMEVKSGTMVASADCAAGASELIFDEARRLIYVVCSSGAVDVIRQVDADHYQNAGRLVMRAGGKSAVLSPEKGMLYVAIPAGAGKGAEVLEFR